MASTPQVPSTLNNIGLTSAGITPQPRGGTSDGGTGLYRIAEAYNQVGEQQQQQLQQETAANEQQQAQALAGAMQRSAQPVFSPSQGAQSAGSFTAEDATEMNHGLAAYPHINNGNF